MKIDFRFKQGSDIWRFTGEGNTEQECEDKALEEFRETVCGLPIDRIEIVEILEH